MFSFLPTRKKGVCSRRLLVYIVVFKFLFNKCGKVSQQRAWRRWKLHRKLFSRFFFQRKCSRSPLEGTARRLQPSVKQVEHSPPCSLLDAAPSPSPGPKPPAGGENGEISWEIYPNDRHKRFNCSLVRLIRRWAFMGTRIAAPSFCSSPFSFGRNLPRLLKFSFVLVWSIFLTTEGMTKKKYKITWSLWNSSWLVLHSTSQPEIPSGSKIHVLPPFIFLHLFFFFLESTKLSEMDLSVGG